MSGELESVDFWSVVLLHTTPKGPVAVLHDLADRGSRFALCGTGRRGGSAVPRGSYPREAVRECEGCKQVATEIREIAHPRVGR